MAVLLNSLNAVTLNPALSRPRVSPPHPEKSEIAFIISMIYELALSLVNFRGHTKIELY